jgi:threonyl-tRNA synthetase
MGDQAEVTVTFPDGSKNALVRGTTLQELAKSLGTKFVKESVAGKINGHLVDLSTSLDRDATIELVLMHNPEAREVIRHSTAHIMASAVKELFPTAKVTIGPAVDDGVNGFYYDFDYERGFNEEDLEHIAKRMDEIIKKDMPFERQEVSREEARKLFSDQGERYKIELLDAIPAGEKVSLYRHSNFVDLCRGPHLPSTGRVKAYKLLGVAGAYWRGDSRNKMLARIYGTAFATKDELKDHLARIEEAKKRDHRLLGKQLDLFSFSPAVGGGLVLWHPKGAKIRYLIEEFWRQTHFDYGYELVNSPHIGKAELWETSGHLSFYRQNMYAPMEIEGKPYFVKPMNCPFHIEIYRSKLRSYRDLPIRFAELGTVYRYEASGVLHGLMRVRGFTQDDAHIFCRADQLDHEIRRCLEHTFFLLRAFGFEEFKIYVSTRPEKFVGELADWEKATETLTSALQSSNMAYEIDPGEGVFYGPKIDIKIKDSLGRTWQCSTIQVDFNLPQLFSMEYVDRDNTRSRPFMVHRALLGSLERFFGVLIEHYAGAFPVWVAPVQAIVLPLTDAQVPYARSVAKTLIAAGVRVEVDERNEKLGYKIREAQLAKVPYMLVVGNREIEQGGVAIRKRDGQDLGFMSQTAAQDLLMKEAAFPQRPIIKEE